MDKREIRSLIKARKALLTPSAALMEARKAFERLEHTEQFGKARHILLYHSLPDEISSREFIAKWAGDKRLYLPRVSGENLEILPYDGMTLRPGAYSICEPEGSDTVTLSEIDLVVVPAVAYDVRGNRVGRGKGYYDRLLSGSEVDKIGIVYDCQLLEAGIIPAENHDIAVDVVITPSATLTIRRKAL